VSECVWAHTNARTHAHRDAQTLRVWAGPREREREREREQEREGGKRETVATWSTFFATKGEGAYLMPALAQVGESLPACTTGTMKADAWFAMTTRPNARMRNAITAGG
jgi:hypothetical protein